MTDNEKLARWQGKCYHVSDWGQTICKYCGRANDPRYFDFDSINPDYLNDDSAAMSLLDTLVEKGMMPVLRIADSNTRVWRVAVYDNYCDRQLVEITGKPTRRAAVVAAVLELIEKEGADE